MLERKSFYIILILFAAVIFAEPSMFWWTSDCGGSVYTRGDSINGASMGQAGMIFMRSTLERSEGQMGYWVQPIIPYLCISLLPDTWELGAIDLLATHTMSDGDELLLSNCSNTPIAVGLNYNHCEPDAWRASYFPAREQCAISCRFSSGSAPLASVYNDNDLLTYDLIWANSTYFGIEGDFIDFGATLKLFMKLIAPSRTSSYDSLQTIYIDLTFKSILP